MHASTLIKPGQMCVWPDYYPDQWIIWVNDADLVSTLIYTLGDVYCNASWRVEWYKEFLNSSLDIEESTVHALVLGNIK